MIPPSIWPWVNDADSDATLRGLQATPAEWLDFIASVTSSLAWPMVVLLLFRALRRPLMALVTALVDRIPAMTSLEAAGFKFGWSETGVKEAVAAVRGVVRHSSPFRGEQMDDRRRETATRLAEIDPGAGVIHAFIGVELAAGNLLARRGESFRGSPISQIRKSDLPRDLKDSILQFASLRNAAAHGHGDITRQSADEYIDGAHQLESSLWNW